MTGRGRASLAMALAVPVAVAAAGPAPAQTQSVCGQAVTIGAGQVRLVAGNMVAACRPGGECAASSHALDRAAELGWSHHLTLSRDSLTGGWVLSLVAVSEPADLASGFTVTVDDNPPLALKAEFLSAPQAANEAFIDTRLTEMIMAELIPGTRARWDYRTAAGESRSATFSLVGLTWAHTWMACAQEALATVTVEAPAPEAVETAAPDTATGDGEAEVEGEAE